MLHSITVFAAYILRDKEAEENGIQFASNRIYKQLPAE
jgi:hypothetical protein